MNRWIPILMLTLCTTAASANWCEDADLIRVEVEGARVIVHHDAALYNCCPDPFAYDVQLAGGVMTMVETEVLTNPCFCICCFDLQATVEDVPAGDWVLVFEWYDYESAAWTSDTVSFTVPDVGQGDPPDLAGAERSECLVESSVDDPAPPGIEWGRMKTYYR